MAIFKAVKAGARLATTIAYISKKEKADIRVLSGISCNPETALEEMKETKEVFEKEGGKQFYHYVQSFLPDEKLTPEIAHEIARELAEKTFSGYEVLIATHTDKDHIHSHFIVNSVSLDTGKKLQFNKFDLQKTRNASDNICRNYNLSICIPAADKITTPNFKKYKVIKRTNSYIEQVYRAVESACEKADSKESFIENLEKQKIKVNWSDTRKYITFEITDEAKNKTYKFRDNNLNQTFKSSFGKENLSRLFEDKRNRVEIQSEWYKELKEKEIPRLKKEYEVEKHDNWRKNYIERITTAERQIKKIESINALVKNNTALMKYFNSDDGKELLTRNLATDEKTIDVAEYDVFVGSTDGQVIENFLKAKLSDADLKGVKWMFAERDRNKLAAEIASYVGDSDKRGFRWYQEIHDHGTETVKQAFDEMKKREISEVDRAAKLSEQISKEAATKQRQETATEKQDKKKGSEKPREETKKKVIEREMEMD